MAGGKETVPSEVMNPTSQDLLVHKGRNGSTMSLVEVSPIATCDPPTTKMTIQPVNEVSEVRLDDELEILCQRIDYPLFDLEREQAIALVELGSFKTGSTRLRRTRLVKHDIKTTTDQPIKQRAR